MLEDFPYDHEIHVRITDGPAIVTNETYDGRSTRFIKINNDLIVQYRWYKTGKKFTSTLFKHGMRHGNHTVWNENGNLRSITMYIYNKQHGTKTTWNNHGASHVSQWFNDVCVDEIISEAKRNSVAINDAYLTRAVERHTAAVELDRVIEEAAVTAARNIAGSIESLNYDEYDRIYSAIYDSVIATAKSI